MNRNNIEIWDETYPCEFLSEDIKNNRVYILIDNNNIISAFALCESSLGETNLNRQRQFLYDAIRRNYKEKYAAISGMFYLINRWKIKGTLGLEEEFKKGYYGFARKTLKGYK